MDDLQRRQGHVRLWRCAMQGRIWKKGPLHWQVFSWCIMRANWEPALVTVRTGRGTTVVALQRGQFVCGRHAAAAELPISPNTIRACLQWLASAHVGALLLKTTPHFTIVTVANYDAYNDACPSGEQATVQATIQANTTDKESKNTRKGATPPKPPAPVLPEIPASLDTPEFREAWAAFVQHRAESGARNKLTRTAAECRLKECERWGPERAARAIIYSIAQGWRGIYAEKSDGRAARAAPGPSKWDRIRPAVPDEDH